MRSLLIMGSKFRELDTYKLAAALGDDVYREVKKWSSDDRWSIGLKLIRSVDGIGANIAEGCGRWHGPDERRFLFIARGSMYEAEHWLSAAIERGLLSGNWLERLEDIARTLSGLINAHGRP